MLKLTNDRFTDTLLINGKEREIVVNTEYSTTMGEDMLSIINEYEEKSWNASAKGLDTGFLMLNKAFCNGLVPGFYMIAADSNIGKSSYVTQITHQMLDLNDNIFIMDFSLDDPMQDKISRLVGSWVKMNSNEVKFPRNREEEVIQRRKLGMYKLANSVDRYMLYDTCFGNDIYRIEEEVSRVKEELHKHTKLVVIIDSFHDLGVDSEPSLAETPKFNKIAQWAADLAIKYDIVLLCTGEIRKSEKDNTRPRLNSLRESIKIRFEAKAIIFLYNDVHYNRSSAEIFFQKDGSDEKFPVLEVDIVKNKISSYKGKIFYYMWPDKGCLIECSKEAQERYRSLI